MPSQERSGRRVAPFYEVLNTAFHLQNWSDEVWRRFAGRNRWVTSTVRCRAAIDFKKPATFAGFFVLLMFGLKCNVEKNRTGKRSRVQTCFCDIMPGSNRLEAGLSQASYRKKRYCTMHISSHKSASIQPRTSLVGAAGAGQIYQCYANHLPNLMITRYRLGIASPDLGSFLSTGLD